VEASGQLPSLPPPLLESGPGHEVICGSASRSRDLLLIFAIPYIIEFSHATNITVAHPLSMHEYNLTLIRLVDLYITWLQRSLSVMLVQRLFSSLVATFA